MMMTHKQLHTITAIMTLLVISLAATNWYFKPEHADDWLVAMAAMPVFWLIVMFSLSRRRLASQSEVERRYIFGSIIVAGTVLSGALGIKLIETLTNVDMNPFERFWGIGMGALVVISGNILPKILSPLVEQHCSPAKTQSLQRFAGWSFVLAGIAYAIVWIVLPVAQAGSVATLILFTSVVLVVLRCGWVFATSRRERFATRCE